MTTAPKTAAKRSKRKPLLIVTTLIFVAIGICYAIWWAIVGAHYESTDDAYVHGNLVQVTSQIAGTVVGIEADDIERVTRGATLVKLDPTDTEVALKQAEASLAQTVRKTRTLFVQNSALQADIDVSQANVELAKVDLSKAESDLNRRLTLAKSGGVSGEEILHARTAEKAAQSGLAQARANLAAAQAKLATNQALTAGTTVEGHPDVQHSADQLRQAWLANARTQLPAPVDGMVAQRSVQVGQRVAPGTPLMTVVPLEHVWVEANFKESQLAEMKPGQNVTLTTDIYGNDVVYHGKLQGITAGTGSAFALLPAQNATGNWIKVVQRVPVRITLDPKELAAHPLRIGLSMTVEVDLSSPASAADANKIKTTLETNAFQDNKVGADALIERIIKENIGS
jgi:membrane fusion protein (multidrug efflux system)